MKTLYFECAMGAAGDMLMGALYELCPEKEAFLADMNRLLPDVTLAAEPVQINKVRIPRVHRIGCIGGIAAP